MANVEHGVFPPIPNESLRNGDPGSSAPLGRQASPVHPYNANVHAGNPGSSANLARHASTVKGSNEDFRFNVGEAKSPQPPSAMQPGKAAIPVNPAFPPNGMSSGLKQPKGK